MEASLKKKMDIIGELGQSVEAQHFLPENALAYDAQRYWRLSYDWQAAALLEQLRLQQKLGSSSNRNAFFEELGGEFAAVAQHGLPLTFEGAGPQTRMRLFLGEFFRVLDMVEHDPIKPQADKNEASSSMTVFSSDLLDCELYREQVLLMSLIAYEKLPSMITIGRLVDVFVHLHDGTKALLGMVSQNISLLQPIWTHLLQPQRYLTQYATRISQFLIQLLQLDPSMAWPLRRRLLQLRILPDVILELSGPDYCNEELIMSVTLAAEHTDWIRSQSSLAGRLHAIARKHLRDTTNSSSLANAATLVRLFCLLVSRLGIRIDVADVPLLLSNARHCPIYIPPLTALLVSTTETQVHILQALDSLASGSSRHILLPWVLDFYAASFSRSDITTPISNRVRETLGISDSKHFVLDENHIRWLQHTFTDKLFPKTVLAQLVLDMPPTPMLQGSMSAPGVAAVSGLITSGVFKSIQCDPQQWILDQLQLCQTPIHHLIPVLIKDYARSGLSRLLERSVWSFFSPQSIDNNSLILQALILYYVLAFNDFAISTPQNTKTLMGAQIQPYPAELLHRLNIRAILVAVSEQHEAFSFLINPLLALAVAQFPHFFGVNGLLLSEAIRDRPPCYQEMVLSRKITARWVANPDGTTSSTLSMVDVQTVLRDCQERPAPARAVLDWLLVLDPLQLQPYQDSLLTILLPRLTSSLPRAFLLSCQSIWEHLALIDPLSVWLATWRAFSSSSSSSTNNTNKQDDVTIETLLQNPIKMFECDMTVFRCPPLFAIFLQCLHGCLVGCRRWLASTAAGKTREGSKLTQATGSDGNVDSLALLQDSVVVQMLLDICTPECGGLAKSATIQTSEGDWEEIAAMTCQFLHQLFIDNVDLPRLLHHQGYQIRLLPLTVNGVASMHICLDFLPELLAQPYQNSVIFAVHLAAHLALKYPIPKSLEVVQGVLQTLQTKTKAATEPMEFWAQVLPAFPVICQAFPDLIPAVLTWMQDLSDSYDNLARTSGLSLLRAAIDRNLEIILEIMLQQPLATVIQSA